MPIFVHRAKAGTGLGFIVAATAAGKALDSLYITYICIDFALQKGGCMHDINSESGTKADIEKEMKAIMLM